MKRYIKDGQIKFRNQIVLHGTRTIKGKDGKEKEVRTQIINPKEEMILADGWEEYVTPAELVEQERKQEEIRVSRRELNATDYKVIKCIEAFLCGEPMPYDIHSLHREREESRRVINENEQ